MKTADKEKERRHKIIFDILTERKKQDEKFGAYNRSIEPELVKVLTLSEYGLPSESDAKHATDEATKLNVVTFGHVITEELCEVIAAEDEDKRREELVQLVAVGVQWIETIDRRKANEKKPAKKKAATKKLKKV